MSISYVAGLAFDAKGERVALVLKNRPAFLAGFYNAIGGHIEDDEDMDVAMIREFMEETGCETTEDDWEWFAAKDNDKFTLNFFVTHLSDERFNTIRTMEDEEIHILNVKDAIFNPQVQADIAVLLLAVYTGLDVTFIQLYAKD